MAGGIAAITLPAGYLGSVSLRFWLLQLVPRDGETAGAAAGRRVRKFVDSDNEHLCRRGIIQTA
jgi:hypothetical protein